MSTNNLFPYEKELKDFVNSIDESDFSQIDPEMGNRWGGFIGFKHTKETKKEISNTKKLQNIKTPGNTGKKFSPETRKKMSISGKGRIFSTEHRKNLSISTKKRNLLRNPLTGRLMGSSKKL